MPGMRQLGGISTQNPKSVALTMACCNDLINDKFSFFTYNFSKFYILQFKKIYNKSSVLCTKSVIDNILRKGLRLVRFTC